MEERNFYFVDNENVSIQTLIACIKNSQVQVNSTVILFCNKRISLTKMEIDILESVFAEVLIELVDIQGKNALDSYLSVSLGMIAAKRKNSTFSIVSNDKGFLHTLLPLRVHRSVNQYRLMSVKNNHFVKIG